MRKKPKKQTLKLSITERLFQLVLIQGVVTFCFGFGVFLLQEVSLILFLSMFTIMVFISGIMTTLFAIQVKDENTHWFWSLFGGIFSILVGLITFSVPDLSETMIVLILSTWAVVWGIVRISMYIKYNEVLFAVTGIIAFIFGVVIFKNPDQGVMTMIHTISFYGMAVGAILTTLAIKLKKETNKLK